MNDHRRHEQDEHDRIVAQLEQRCIALEAERAEWATDARKDGFALGLDEAKTVLAEFMVNGDIEGACKWAGVEFGSAVEGAQAPVCRALTRQEIRNLAKCEYYGPDPYPND